MIVPEQKKPLKRDTFVAICKSLNAQHSPLIMRDTKLSFLNSFFRLKKKKTIFQNTKEKLSRQRQFEYCGQ